MTVLPQRPHSSAQRLGGGSLFAGAFVLLLAVAVVLSTAIPWM